MFHCGLEGSNKYKKGWIRPGRSECWTLYENSTSNDFQTVSSLQINRLHAWTSFTDFSSSILSFPCSLLHDFFLLRPKFWRCELFFLKDIKKALQWVKLYPTEWSESVTQSFFCLNETPKSSLKKSSQSTKRRDGCKRWARRPDIQMHCNDLEMKIGNVIRTMLLKYFVALDSEKFQVKWIEIRFTSNIGCSSEIKKS